eukprot:TRINITY_DN104074_c0_g1_i1.p1 TRINITY_DN104074_c0_g1~~TRINITY_DN104074_c0_g1_i1.p1  ORF type:complete len:325 (-),score=34.34 TRINITY_DN104074_c0_g1_i1:123-1097(-)
MSVVSKLALVGGTHGNERCGIAALKHFQKKNPEFDTFSLSYLLGNEEAIKLCRRYKDRDLNRCFLLPALSTALDQPDYEQERAQFINQLLGPKGTQSATDYILDLHNTTSKTGILLCYHPQDTLSQEIAAYLQSQNKSVKVNLWCPDKDGDVGFLPSIGRLGGMTVEVGDCAHGTTRATVVNAMIDVVTTVLRYLEKRNQLVKQHGSWAAVPQKEVQCKVAYRFEGSYIPYPEDGFIHEKWELVDELGDNETTSRLFTGDPLFQCIDGQVINFAPQNFKNLTQADVDEGLYPLFVAEAAYVEKNIAMMVVKKRLETCNIIEVCE